MSTSNEFQRLAADGITQDIHAADADYSLLDLPRVPCVGATWARIGAVCGAPGQTLTGQWLTFDSPALANRYHCVSTSPKITFTSAPSSIMASIGVGDIAGPYLATPDIDAIVRLDGAFSFIFLVVSMTNAPAWNLFGRVYFPGLLQ